MSRLRVMTFNIANALETEDDGENAWAFRAPLNGRTIKRYAPDLIGFQQCDDGNLEMYRSALAEYQYILGTRRRWPRPLSTITPSPICRERLELLDSGGFYLSETPEVWSLGWDATYVKALTWARFRQKENPGELQLSTRIWSISASAPASRVFASS